MSDKITYVHESLLIDNENFLLCAIGGPHPGNRIVGSSVMEWPLPDSLPDEGGNYVKTSESQLPPQTLGSRVMRGAEYAWVPSE